MTVSEMYAHSIGLFASNIIQEEKLAVVSGVTSQGAYLLPDNNLVIYMSSEGFRGPLTINAPGINSLLGELHRGSRAVLSPSGINFPDQDLRVDLSRTEIWKGDLPVNPLSKEELKKRFLSLIEVAAKLSSQHELLPILKIAAGGNGTEIPGFPGFSDHLLKVCNSLKDPDLVKVARQLQKLMGFGLGLTPLGDDIILGILMTLNRWNKYYVPNQNLKDFNQRLLDMADKNTNKISASLFVPAVEGLGDERLLIVLDSIFSGAEPTTDQIKTFLDWGNSSGIGVFAGMLGVVRSLF